MAAELRGANSVRWSKSYRRDPDSWRDLFHGASLRELAVRLLPTDDRVAQDADLLDLAFHHVAGLEIPGFGIATEGGHARDGAGGDHVAGAVSHGRIMRQDLRNGDRHFAGVGILPRLSVHAQLHSEIVRIADLIRRNNVRPQRAESIYAFAKAEDARLHFCALYVARGDVIKNQVATDVIGRFSLAEMLAGFFDDHRQLQFVIQLAGEVGRVNHRLVGADDGVHDLKENDPWQNR